MGQWLAKRYIKIIGPKYDPNQIYVRATDFDRTIASALANLAGMFPPEGHQIWGSNLKWQPIPVHSVPAEFDYILGSTVPSCPAYEEATNKLMNSTKIKHILSKVQPITDEIAKNVGIADPSIFNDLIIRDTLFIENLKHKMYVRYKFFCIFEPILNIFNF